MSGVLMLPSFGTEPEASSQGVRLSREGSCWHLRGQAIDLSQDLRRWLEPFPFKTIFGESVVIVWFIAATSRHDVEKLELEWMGRL